MESLYSSFTKFSASVLSLALLFIHGVSAAPTSNKGFLSLACGATSDFIGQYDDFWISDFPYIKDGKTSSIQLVQGKFSTTVSLRYFPTSSLGAQKKNCYEIPLQQEGPHMIRGTFLYKNYDGLNTPPYFHVYFGPISIGIVDLSIQDPWVEEVIWTASSVTAMKFCLVASTKDVAPVISSLELRPVSANAYWAVLNNEIILKKRADPNCCSKYLAIRYSQDLFDHLWIMDYEYLAINFTVVVVLNNTENVIEYGQLAATEILRYARVFLDHDILKYNLKSKRITLCFISDFFVESLPADMDLFHLTMNGGISEHSKMEEDRGLVNSLTSQEVGAVMNLPIEISNLHRRQLRNVEDNKVIEAAVRTPSFAVSALHSIQSTYGFNLSWDNDPCIPVQWERLTCSFISQSPIITALNLSNMDLRGGVVPSFGDLIDLHSLYLQNNMLMGELDILKQLVNLEILDLSSNKLSGPLPDDLQTLTHLKQMYLQNNDLSGTLPDTLGDIKSLEELNVENNELRGPIPESLNRPSLRLRTAGNICLNFSVTSCSTNAPTLSPSPASSVLHSEDTSTQKSKKRTMDQTRFIAGAIIAGISILLFSVGCMVVGLMRKKRKQRANPVNQTAEYAKSWNGIKSFSLKELKSATNNFKDVIGKGSFGPVFLGKLSNGQRVAVKVRTDASKLGEDSFVNEVFLLSQVQHPNLVLLKGFCQESKQQILVYEYMSGGTLSENLHGAKSKKRPLGWKKRLKILADAAAGLEYLHHGDPKIIHRDVKTSNILLDGFFAAKVSDFGLSKYVADLDATHVTTAVKGTAGYLDPEYYSTRQLTEKSDVYSLGIVMFETICGREPLSHNYNPEQYNLVFWAKPLLESHSYQFVVDKAIENGYKFESMKAVAQLAIQCVNLTAAQRPTMEVVERQLRAALVIEEESSDISFKTSPSFS